MTTNAKMSISTTVGEKGARKRQEIGQIDYYLPSLNEFAPSLPEPDSRNEYGEPQYGDDSLGFVQDAVTAKVQGIVRNLAKVRDDLSGFDLVRDVPDSLEALLESGGGARYFEVRKLACEAFATYTTALTIPAVGKEKLNAYFSSTVRLAEAAPKVKAAFASDFQAFIGGLD